MFRALVLLLVLTGCDRFRQKEPVQSLFMRDEPYAAHREAGTYHCTKCGHPLFSSQDKLAVESRWPVFSRPLTDAVRIPATALTAEDMVKFVCARCGLHAGQFCRGGELLAPGAGVDGAEYCALSAALRFTSGATVPSHAE